jgi:rhodanese-related sulfurtransferase
MVKSLECEVAELRLQLESDSVTLVDVREFAEYAAGRIPGSRFIPLGQLALRSDELDRGCTVFMVCRTGRRAAEGRQRLLSLGFNNVICVSGGFAAWQAAGFPVERDERAPWSLERQVRLVAGSIVLLAVLLAVFVAQPFVWLAAFIGAGLAFAAITDSCLMGMMLARLPWNRIDYGQS